MSKIPYVAIVGQTNVGKSSLFNRLYGSPEAIVAREAGTTRDNVIRKITVDIEEKSRGTSRITNLRGRGDVPEFTSETSGVVSPSLSFWLVDTAGLKTAEDDFEASIQEQIHEATELADVILVVVDSTLYPSDQDRRIAKTALKSKKPVILVLNKVDLKGSLPVDEFKRLGIKEIVRTSAEHNRGISALQTKITGYLPKIKSSEQRSETNSTIKIALIGRPNVGKSYLFNTLAGKQQAIVANIAGTTRDVNRISIRYKGQNIELLDTAGVRRQGKQEVGIEKFSVLRTLSAVDEADVCFLLMDARELNTQLDQKLAGLAKEAGKGLVLVVSKWDAAEDKDAYTRDALAPKIAHEYAFVPWAPLIFTSAVTGQNVTKLFDLATDIHARRQQQIKTNELNKVLQDCVAKHPPAGLKNTMPKLRYIVQTDTRPPWFVIFGGNLKLLHWSYKRYLERKIRETFDFAGTPIMFSFRQEAESGRKKQETDKKYH